MIVVTGATGFIGSAIVWQLNSMGYKDILVCDTIRPTARPGILDNREYTRFVTKDELLTELQTPDAQKIQWIIHMGACSSTTEMDVDFLKENNTELSLIHI